MVPELVDLLKQIPRLVGRNGASPYVFNNPDTGTRWIDIKKGWGSALKVSGVRDFTFHDLRHTFASRLVQRGVSLKAVQELLGHSNIKTTMRYAHLAPDNLRSAVEVLSERVKSSGSNVPSKPDKSDEVGTNLAQSEKGSNDEIAQAC